jgi:polyphenol oxidase
MLKLHRFKIFEPFKELIHGFSYSPGGVSSEFSSSLNCGHTSYDTPENVSENRRRLFEKLQVDKVAFMHQVHGATIEAVNSQNYLEKRRCDGISTKEKRLALFSLTADCQPALFYDPTKGVIANVHAGWRGQVGEMYLQTVKHLESQYGCRPSDLFVAIGPSLGPNASEFIHYKKEIPEKYWKFQFKPFYFDLWALARHQLENTGIPSCQIEIAQVCTYSNHDCCFSHRRHPESGRHASVVCLN